MTYADLLRELYPGLAPTVGDLYLLEAHQIADLPVRAPGPELAAVLHAHPDVRGFLVARYPQIEGFLATLMAEHNPAGEGDLATYEQAVVWELADWIVYQRAPELYDSATSVDWDLTAVTEIADLEGKSVIDAGAGTGRVAFGVSPHAHHVYAIEPVATLRRYMREKAIRLRVRNLFVVDGFLSALPFPPASADVLITCQAIGWSLSDELSEIDRVVKPGGFALHLFGASSATEADNPLFDALAARGYQPDTYRDGGVLIRRFWKRIGG